MTTPRANGNAGRALTERERVGRERGTRNTLSLTLAYLRPSDKREERRATHKKRARASNSTPFQWWQAPSERCYLRCCCCHCCCCCRCRLINSSVCACVRASERVNTTTVWWEVVVWCAERVGEMRAELDCQAKCCRTVAWLFCLLACLCVWVGGSGMHCLCVYIPIAA